MYRQRLIAICGLAVVVLSAGAGIVFRQTVHQSPEAMVALFLAVIAGTSIATASLFYQRLEQSTESTRSSVKALEASEARFRHLFDISPFPASVTSLKTNRVLAVNQRTSERFGITPAKAVGLPVMDFYVDPARREEMV